MTAPRGASRWFDDLPPITVSVGCSGALHAVSGRRGKLVLHDHRLADEEALLALGGDPPPCVAVLVAWRDRAGWAAASRPPPAGFVRRPRAPAVPDGLAPTRRLGVIRSWERRWRRSGEGDAAEDIYWVLRRTAIGPLTRALDATRRRVGGGRATYAEIRLAPREAPPSVVGRIDARTAGVTVALHPSWLYGVAPQIDEVLDRDPEAFPLGDGRRVAWQRGEGRGGDVWVAYAS